MGRNEESWLVVVAVGEEDREGNLVPGAYVVFWSRA
jgi:hypothetical protein